MKTEREREIAEQDAMFREDPHTLDWWNKTRETAAMAAHDDWHLLFPVFRSLDRSPPRNWADR